MALAMKSLYPPTPQFWQDMDMGLCGYRSGISQQIVHQIGTHSQEDMEIQQM